MNHSALSKAVLETHGDAIIAVDRAGLITFWNSGAERIFGFSGHEAIGLSLDLIIPENLRERHNFGFTQAMETGASRYGADDLLSVPALRKDKTRISVEFSVTFIRDEAGGITGMAAVLRDATKRYQEMRALRAQISELEKKVPKSSA